MLGLASSWIWLYFQVETAISNGIKPGQVFVVTQHMKLPIQYAFAYPKRIENKYARFSFSKYNTKEEIDYAVTILKEFVLAEVAV